MKRIERWARQSAGQLYERLHRWLVPPYATRIVDDYLPKQLRKRTLYIVQEDGLFEQAAMLCPCGCKRILHMNLLPDERPCWRVTQHKDGTATLCPSVWRKTNCQSHFWFERGRIRWFRARARFGVPDSLVRNHCRRSLTRNCPRYHNFCVIFGAISDSSTSG